MYCAANTYFYLVRALISLFVRVPFYRVCMYVNLRVPVCLYVNIRGFDLRTRIRLFVRVPFFPVCLSVNLRGFGPHSSVRTPLSPLRRVLHLSPNTRWISWCLKRGWQSVYWKYTSEKVRTKTHKANKQQKKITGEYETCISTMLLKSDLNKRRLTQL